MAQRFELRERIGEGGMGVVYRAWDRTLGKEVALKRMHEIGATQLQRLKSEFRARSALQHRNLVQLFELVVEGSDCFFTMELVDGVDLESWVRRSESTGAPSASGLRRSRSKRDGENTTTLERKEDHDERELDVDDPFAIREASPPHAPPLDTEGTGRLRAALAELCVALAVLHDAAIVHRDIKPSNVLVTPTGRVVLLDFGLAATPAAQQEELAGAGTPRYMAPEQIRAETATAAADLFAVGGILYELLTGRSPFGGSVLSNQLVKAAGARPTPIELAVADAELAALALDLLAPTPSSRPDAREVLRRLAGQGNMPSLAPTFGLPVPGGFVGREAEYRALTDGFARVVSEGHPAAVVVEGPSGIGKSTLIRKFLADVKTRERFALVLASRCHPQETVPFKALDAAMDALAEHARRVGDLETFEPAMAHAAVRLFPVLRTVPQLGEQPEQQSTPDDQDLRAAGFDALRDLFGRLAARGPVVLWIDDAQWDDADSVALVEALLRPLGTPAPPVFLLVSTRPESRESSIVRRLTDETRRLVPVTRIALGPLRAEETSRLAALFLGEGDRRISGVVEQSEGNPFLASELARYLGSGESSSALRTVDVQALVSARLRDLAPAERALLEVASLAVRPLPTRCVIEAAKLTDEARTAALALRDAFLLREGGAGPDATIAPYHDKIAEAMQRLISTEHRRALHRALAETLERHQPDDAEALWVHWEGAEETTRAAECAYRAAEHAASTLAFDRAAALYEKTIALGGGGIASAPLFERAGAAHANHGRAAEAARCYLDASRALGDDIGNARVRTVKRLAAEQYVKGGYVRLGWEVMRSVLDAAGISTPTSPARATLGALRRRLRFLARRIDVDGIGDRRIPEHERARLEILWTASTSMSMVDVTLSDAFRTRHLERILDVGDASSIARALAYEAALEVHVGGALLDWHADRLLEHARRLVDRTRDPYDVAWLQLGIANRAYCAGRFREAADACNASLAILRSRCSGVAWEITTVMAFLLTSLAMLGELSVLRETAERFAVDAEARGDLFGAAEGYSGECILAWWSSGQMKDAFGRARKAVARQGGDSDRWPETTQRRGQLTELMATVHVQLIEGDPWPAWQMMLDQWDGLKKAMIPSLQFYRSWLRHGRARVALAAAEHCGRRTTSGHQMERAGWTRERFLDDARRMQRQIARDTRPFAMPWATLIEGALANARGDRKGALHALERALTGFARADMALYREATRWRLAQLSGAGSSDEAEAWLSGQGISDGRALVDALIPGYGDRRGVSALPDPMADRP